MPFFRRCAAPDVVAGNLVLTLGEDQRDIQRDPCGRQLFQGIQTGRRGGHLDHPILMPLRPLLAQGDIPFDPLGVRDGGMDVFKERVKLEADVAVVALGLLPDGVEHFLGVVDEMVGHLPGDVGVILPFADQLGDVVIEAAGLDQVRDDDRVARRAACAQRPVGLHQLRVDRIEPDLSTGGNQGLKRHGGSVLSSSSYFTPNRLPIRRTLVEIALGREALRGL